MEHLKKIVISSSKSKKLKTLPFLIILLIAFSIILIKLAGTKEVAYTAGADIDWPQYQHDAQSTGYTTAQVDPDPAADPAPDPSNALPAYTVRWSKLDDVDANTITGFASAPGTFLTDGLPLPYRDNLELFDANMVISNNVQPIVAQDTVFVGSMYGKFYAIDALTGLTTWSYQTGAPIMGTAAYEAGVVMVASLDGNVYGFNPTNGSLLWTRPVGGPVSAHLKVQGGYLYVGTRSGTFYKIAVANGSVAWQYTVQVPGDPTSPFAGSPIVAPAVLAADNSKVFFTAENMRMYGLNVSNGSVSWISSPMYGQSTALSVPMIHQGIIYVYTSSSLIGAEETSTDAEAFFETIRTYNGNGTYNELLTPDPGQSLDEARIEAETTFFRNYLNVADDPYQRIFFAYDPADGSDGFVSPVPMGRVTGTNWTPLPPISTPDGLLTYWRSSFATFFADTAPFGSDYCPDLSYLDTATATRVNITTDVTSMKACPELDNGFFLTKGGTRLFMQNSFRGTWTIDMSTGETGDVEGTLDRISTAHAKWDFGEFRNYPYDIIYYGNDAAPQDTTTEVRPIKPFDSTGYHSGIIPVVVNGIKILVINDNGTDVGMTAGLVVLDGI